MESDIKKDICDYLESQGFYPVLNIVTNRNGFPDVTVYCPDARVFLVETKQPGKGSSVLQQYRHDEMRKKLGIRTFQVDNKKHMIQIISNGEYLPDKS